MPRTKSQANPSSGIAGKMKSRAHQVRIETPQGGRITTGPGQESHASQRTRKCGSEDLIVSYEHRASTSSGATNTFSNLRNWSPSERRASSHPGSMAEEGICPARRSSSVSTNDCIIVAALGSLAQKDCFQHVTDFGDLASSDGDDLSSLDSADFGDFEESQGKACQIDPGTSLNVMRRFVGGSLGSGHNETEISDSDPNGDDYHRNTPNANEKNYNKLHDLPSVEAPCPSEGGRSKTRALFEEHGRWCYAGVVPGEVAPSMLGASNPDTSASRWEGFEAQGILERNSTANIERFKDCHVPTTAPSNRQRSDIESNPAQSDESSYNGSQTPDTSIMPDTNGCFTYFDNLTASVQPALPISPKPLTHFQNTSSNGVPISEPSPRQLPRSSSLVVYNAASDALPMPPPFPPPSTPLLSASQADPPNNLEASTLYQARISDSESQWQPYQNTELVSSINAQASNQPAPSCAGRNRSLSNSPKAPLPTFRESHSGGMAQFSQAFTAFPHSSPMTIKISTFLSSR